MRIDVVTLFPEFFAAPLDCSILARARRQGLLEVAVHNLRDHADDPHRSVDDTPYGGGGGMVLKVEPLQRAWEALELGRGHCVYLTADGERLDQRLAIRLSLMPHLVLLCGHYKGVDERFRERHIDQELSIGDYVLTGGEPAALVLIDAVTRLIPGVLGNFASALEDSFQEGFLDCPWYTRPVEALGARVPEVLVSGDHEEVSRWRRREALRRTFERRPDLLPGADLDDEERALVARWSAASESPRDHRN
jgi:tRNA (guanine37-N1)-methyltransferase